ncbi:MAG: insulinase family protein [Candidatus Hydrogenedentes bacterium]|nr:insulinase family protein [Candidatus Hydrogenedentota bacterium]
MISRISGRFGTGLLLFFLSAFPSWAGYKVVHEPAANDPMAVTIYELDNGLTVYLTENHEQPRFYSEIVVRAGSKHDPADTTGLAHYLEHLLFKGTQKMGTLDYEKEKAHLDAITALYEEHFNEDDTEKRKAIYARINDESKQAAQYAIPNEFDRLYKAMGATDLNAHTSTEETVYKVELPSNRFEQWAVIETERFTAPIFRLFQPELEIVYEEKNRSMDNKDRLIHEAVSEKLYKVHPYGQQTTLGTVEHLKKPSLVNIMEFYETYYVPNNMAICVSGDIKKDEAIAVIDEHFSAWKPQKLPKPARWRERPLDGIERVTVQYPGEEYVLLAFRTAPLNHKDADALSLLDMALSNTAAGLIDLNLVQQQKVRGAGAFPYLQNDYGAQFLFGIPKDGQSLEDVEKLLLDQIEIIKSGELEDWVIPAIITDFKKMRKAGLESDESRVSSMRESYIAFQDWDRSVAQLDRMAKLTKRDIQRVAKKYFKGDFVAGHRVDGQHDVPKIEKPKIDLVQIDPGRESQFAKTVLAMAVEPLQPAFLDPGDYSITDDPGGIRFYYTHNPLNDLFALSFAVDFGTDHDNRLAAARELIDLAGTSKYPAEELKKEWYKLGTNFNFGVSDSESSFSIDGLDENLEKSIELMMDVINNPSTDQQTVDQLKQIIIERREDAKKDPATISAAVVQFHRYGPDSSFLRMMPGDQVKQLTSEELFGLTKGLLEYKHAVSYVGSLPRERVIELIRKYHPINGALKDVPPYRVKQMRQPERTEIYFYDKETAQSQVQIDFPSEPYNEARVPAINMFNNYFGGGMAGLVFQELREARALAYAVGARYVTGARAVDQNYMVGGIGTQTDKTPEAIEGFVELFDAMPVSEDRFAISRASLLNSFTSSRLGFREVLNSVRSWERLGLEPDPRKARYEAAVNADVNLLMDFYKTQISGRPKLISITGDKSKIDMTRLAKIGPIREVGQDEIFVK